MKRLFFLALILSLTSCHRSLYQKDPIVAIQIQDRNGITETISTPDRLQVYESFDFLSPQPYKKILRVYSENGRSHSKITTYHPNGTVWQYLEAEEMRAQGAYREWYPNGQMRLEATVIGGTADVVPGAQSDWLFDGKSKVWNEKGNVIAEIPYNKGQLDGESRYYYSNGQLERSLPYKDNQLEGLSRHFYFNGALKSETHFENGEREGESTGYFPAGQKAWEEEYSKGLLKTGTYFNPAGEIISKIANGAGQQALFDGESLDCLVEFHFGKPEGLVQQFTPSGGLLKTYTQKNGKKIGEEIEYYLSSEMESEAPPTPKVSIHWSDDMIHGRVRTWYSNGQLQSEREYCRNQKMGPCLAWYRSGALMFVEEYEDGQLIKGQYYKVNQRDPISSIVNGNGIASLFDENGVFIRKITYVKGKPLDPEE